VVFFAGFARVVPVQVAFHTPAEFTDTLTEVIVALSSTNVQPLASTSQCGIATVAAATAAAVRGLEITTSPANKTQLKLNAKNLFTDGPPVRDPPLLKFSRGFTE